MPVSAPRSGQIGIALLASLAWSAAAGPAGSPALPVEELELVNGMRFLLLARPTMPTVEAGWVVAAGSADDPVGESGMAHLIEHMMFKGSRLVGSLDIDRELELLGRISEVEQDLASARGAPEGRSGRRAERRRLELEGELADLERQAAALSRLGAFSLEYSRVGATRLDANTAEDVTLYYVTLPAETLELWFWLESDRLRQPVFRELGKEKAVIAEERGLRVASTPTGEADLAFDTLFWQGTPYANPPLGRTPEVERLGHAEIEEFFTRHYRPDALTAVLVGNFDPERARELATRYFGRLEPGAAPSPRKPAIPAREAEETLTLTCNCPAQVRLRYPTVAFGHPDQFALQLLAGVLNGRNGRLYRHLVLGREVAFAAFAQQTPLRRAGSFTVTLEAKGATRPETLVEAWDHELAAISAEAPSDAELERVRRRLATEHLDQLKDPHLLMRRLLIYAGLGDWRQLAEWSRRLDAVDPRAVAAAASRYLVAERRLVGTYEREAGR